MPYTYVQGLQDIHLGWFLKEQREFQELLCQAKYNCRVKDLTSEQRNDILKTHVLMLMGESYELLDELNWKAHKKDREVNWEKVREEYVDMFKLVLNFLIYLDISTEELVQEFLAKSQVVRARLAQEFAPQT